jgi:hypothetical protein
MPRSFTACRAVSIRSHSAFIQAVNSQDSWTKAASARATGSSSSGPADATALRSSFGGVMISWSA